MLEGLRAVQSTWVGKAILAVVMGFIVVSFVVWGIGDIFRGIGSNQIAKVGSVEITAQAFRQAFQNELQTLTQRLKRPVTTEEAQRFGLDAQVLSRMIADAVLDDRVNALGLALSDADMAKAITSDPTFAGPSGEFDRTRFNRMLGNENLSEQGFVREQRHVYLRQELVQAIAADLAVPNGGLDALHRFETEARSLDTIVLAPSLVEPVADPDAAALQGYFDAHKQAFDAPQYRKLVVLSLSPAALAKPGDVSDEDARKLYDEVKAVRYGSADQRDVQQIVFPDAGEAAAASAKIKAGTSFAEIAAERKLDTKDFDLGNLAKAQIFDKTIADAAFSLPLGGTSEPVQGAFGTVIVHVEPARIKPFEEAAPELKAELATRRAADQVRDLQTKIEDARASGKTLDEVAKSLGLETRTIDAVDAAGEGKDGKPVEGLLDGPALLKAAFASDVGVDNDTVRSRDGGVTWFEVAGIEPARPRPLDEVKAQVTAAWHRDEVAKRLDAKAADLVKDAENGQTLSDIAAANGGLAVNHLDGVTRAGGGDLSQEAVTKVFDGPVGFAGSAPSGSDSRVLFKVLSSTVPARDPQAPQAKEAETRYRNALAEDLLGAYLARVGAEVGAKVNQNALRAAVSAPAY